MGLKISDLTPVAANSLDGTEPVELGIPGDKNAPNGAFLPPGYIDGLKMQWDAVDGITVTSGAAYIQSLGRVARLAAAISKSALVLTASTWYHVYLYLNAGVPDVEIVATAPAAPYNGAARSKTGDTSRRYVGSLLTDASGNIVYMVPPERWGWTDVEVSIDTTPQTFDQGAFVIVEYTKVARDVASEFDTGTYTFTPTESGLYAVSAYAHPEKMTDGQSAALGIFIGGTEVKRVSEQVPRSPSNLNGGQMGGSTMMWLQPGQAVTVRLYCGGSQTGVYIDGDPILTYATFYRMQ